jgi:hypothetical protein
MGCVDEESSFRGARKCDIRILRPASESREGEGKKERKKERNDKKATTLLASMSNLSSSNALEKEEEEEPCSTPQHKQFLVVSMFEQDLADGHVNAVFWYRVRGMRVRLSLFSTDLSAR